MVEYQLGDDVSYGIGGDSYYDGKITRITKRFIFVDSGNKYTRKIHLDGTISYRATGNRYSWLRRGRYEYMDPHF
jgi:hypothetical protein